MPAGIDIPVDFSEQLLRLRGQLELTQTKMAEKIGVSFATVNRWENGKSKPSALAWGKIEQLLANTSDDEEHLKDATAHEQANSASSRPQIIDFTADPEVVRTVVEGERLSYGHTANPTFATEISRIDPLPHQRIAVYDHMLQQTQLRFLLADDAGAGKTIMAGLYIREMLNRRLLRRVLIVPPAGLVGNWQREMKQLFNLPFSVVSGTDATNGNPFAGECQNLVIVSVDTLAGSKMFARLADPDVQPYDLVIFDEAHKLSVSRGADLRVKKTDRYKLAEAIAGAPDHDEGWDLPWSSHHLLLLTATPHMGKEYPYFGLWRLLDPLAISTPEAFSDFPTESRQTHFIRRTKEEMVKFDGAPLYPVRISDTLTYTLGEGSESEQHLYDETTEYLRTVYNRAKLLNRSAAQLAMSVFQRRLASSTFALMRSFQRRLERLDKLIEDVRSGRITVEQLLNLQRRLAAEGDVLDTKTADEESATDNCEENEISEENLLQGVIASSLSGLVAEKEEVQRLCTLSETVFQEGDESKFARLTDILNNSQFEDQKLLVFTEHRDTLNFLVRRLEGMGYTGQVAQIHGGMPYQERDQQVEFFRRAANGDGARIMVATDAAGEGINLQFCWVMVNYDIPWNPARLEQRMGRIHRYGQKHDPVIILNLVAANTREGRVLKTLLDKLETIRKELDSDKVFDVIGRVFEGVSLRDYMEHAVVDKDLADVERQLQGKLTSQQVQALSDRERKLYGNGGDVKTELPRLQESLNREAYIKLLPGYVRQYLQSACPLLNISITGDLNTEFCFGAAKPGALDPLLRVIDDIRKSDDHRFVLNRPDPESNAVWLHPGEEIFEGFRYLVSNKLGDDALRGAIFVDVEADEPYLLHVALASAVRFEDPELTPLQTPERLGLKLVGLKQNGRAEIQECPVEKLLLLRGTRGLPGQAQKLASSVQAAEERARSFLVERVARHMADKYIEQMLSSLQNRDQFIRSGFDYREAELAAARSKQSRKARDGNKRAAGELARIKEAQRKLTRQREEALKVLHREPELIGPGPAQFIAHALVIPSSDPQDAMQQDKEVEEIAMQVVSAYERAEGATVRDVHTPALAREAGLSDYPGFDLLSMRPDGEKRPIEVKGRASGGEVEVSANEWARAANLRDRYWLYVVYDCGTSSPRLFRVQDPFEKLLARSTGSMRISQNEIQAMKK